MKEIKVYAIARLEAGYIASGTFDSMLGAKLELRSWLYPERYAVVTLTYTLPAPRKARAGRKKGAAK